MDVPPCPIDRHARLLRVLNLGRLDFLNRGKNEVELAHLEFISLREASLACLRFVFNGLEFLKGSNKVECFL